MLEERERMQEGPEGRRGLKPKKMVQNNKMAMPSSIQKCQPLFQTCSSVLKEKESQKYSIHTPFLFQYPLKRAGQNSDSVGGSVGGYTLDESMLHGGVCTICQISIFFKYGTYLN